MRQGQQNRRGRNRSGGRKPQSALTRNFESNGPNVKIRGTAAHIAEKYLALARDALSSGDMIVAEGYFQHAEHYNRIIMAAQAEKQNGANRPAPASGNGRDQGDELDNERSEDEAAPSGDEPAQASGGDETDQATPRRRGANGSGNAEADGTETPKPSRGAQARRKRQKVESTSARQKTAKTNGANTGSDSSAPEGYSA